MALTGFCSTCNRTVYLDANDTPVCPVCSTPIMDTIPPEPSETPRDAHRSDGEK